MPRCGVCQARNLKYLDRDMLSALRSVLVAARLLSLGVIGGLHASGTLYRHLLIRVDDLPTSRRLSHRIIHEGRMMLRAHGDFLSTIFQKLIAIDDISSPTEARRALVQLNSLATIGTCRSIRPIGRLLIPLRLRAPMANPIGHHLLVLLCKIGQILHLTILGEGNALVLRLILELYQELLLKCGLLPLV